MRLSDEELEAFCDDKIAREYPNMSFMRLAYDLRDLRAAARAAVEAFGTAIPGVDPGIMYETWWIKMAEVMGKLSEATGGDK